MQRDARLQIVDLQADFVDFENRNIQQNVRLLVHCVTVGVVPVLVERRAARAAGTVRPRRLGPELVAVGVGCAVRHS
ncbi:MAG TPA: hypothetical protein VIP48_17720 [Streptosporangiaceae bacterium]